MRRVKKGGKCAECGKDDPQQIIWESFYHVIDFGVGDPIEPTFEPDRCDACELERSKTDAVKLGYGYIYGI